MGLQHGIAFFGDAAPKNPTLTYDLRQKLMGVVSPHLAGGPGVPRPTRIPTQTPFQL